MNKFKIGDTVRLKRGCVGKTYLVAAVVIHYDLDDMNSATGLIDAMESALEKLEDTHVKVISAGETDGPSYVLPRDTASYNRRTVELAAQGRAFRVSIVGPV